MSQQTDGAHGGIEDIDPSRPITPGQVAEDLNDDLTEPVGDEPGGPSVGDADEDEDIPTVGI